MGARAGPSGRQKRAARRGLGGRETERLARGKRPQRAAPVEVKGAEADIAALERQLGDMIGLKVRIVHGRDGGSVTLAYSSLDQLDMICQRLSGEPI